MAWWPFTRKRADSPQPKIYLSYRRTDSRGEAGRLFDRLSSRFGGQNVFMDIELIAPGSSFTDSISQEIAFSDLVLVLIGPHWLQMLQARSEDQNDFVRLEIEAAIRLRKPIVPVLLAGARMPTAEELPEPMRLLTRLQGAYLRHETFSRDVERLEEALIHLVNQRGSQIEEPTEEISVFVSHSSVDRAWVENHVIKFLRASSVKTWYSREAITSASQWEREILKGMEACDWFSLVVSPAAAESEWVKDEIFWAMQYRAARIVPIIKENCDLYRFHIRLPRIEHVNFTRDEEVARQKLLSCLKSKR